MISEKKIFFNKNIDYIKLSSYKGELEIYSKHSPILFIVKNTFIKIYKKKYIYFYICKGFLEFKFNKLILLVNKLIKPNIINKKKYLVKRKKILNKLKKKNIYKNINKFLKLNLKLNKYNNIIYYINKNLF